MIKDLKMELLNSEQAEAINGGAPGDGCFVCPCDKSQQTTIVRCEVTIIEAPQCPNQLQNQLYKWSGIISADRSESYSIK